MWSEFTERKDALCKATKYCFIFISSVKTGSKAEASCFECGGREGPRKKGRIGFFSRGRLGIYLPDEFPISSQFNSFHIQTDPNIATTRSLIIELVLSRHDSIYKYIPSFDPLLSSRFTNYCLFLESYRNSVSISISISSQPLRSFTCYTLKVFTIGDGGEVVKPCSNRSFRRVSFKQRWYSAGA